MRSAVGVNLTGRTVNAIRDRVNLVWRTVNVIGDGLKPSANHFVCSAM